jgi:hypothetical protein
VTTAYLRSPLAIRARCEAVFEAALAGSTEHFAVELAALPAVVDEVVRVTRERYPDLRIPAHGRINDLRAVVLDERATIDLVVISVLQGDVLAAFQAGAFSSDPAQPLRVDAAAIATSMPGLAAAMTRSPTIFVGGRPSGLLDHFRAIAPHQLPAAELLTTLLDAAIVPDDIGKHRAAGGSGPTEGLVPLHRLAQWLAYSLFEPLERAGVPIAQPEALTGLADDRNGGLLLDLGAIVPKHPLAATPDPELVVEWRALTVALLDRVATGVRERLGATPLQLPLACVLEGGTYAAGIAVANRLRGGAPPIRIE